MPSLGFQPRLDASTSVLFTYHFPLILGLGTKFLDSNVVQGSTKYVDTGTCISWQNHSDPARCGRLFLMGESLGSRCGLHPDYRN